MTVSAGTRLGPYEITVPIGKGGMGEVWKARDTRLGRDVAIKISAEQFSERFEREARAVAALNHPNICTLHDVGPNYLVMEYIEGVTLAERIKEGPIPLEEALSIARHVADALDAAHEKNIIHRDLKPGNIKIKPDGAVKVLDFGLAKMGGTPTAGKAEDSPTLTLAATQAGMILGTAAYMSPEQARGKEVDKRADIWAFGVVLYEMLTGEKLFQMDDITDTLAAVLRHEPDWESVPAKVRRLLRKCLEKDPKKRLRDIGDWQELLDETPHAERLSHENSRRKWLWPAVAFGFFFIGAGMAYWLRQVAVEPIRKLTILPPDGASLVEVAVGGSSLISPDGRTIAFVAEKSGQRLLWTRPLDSLEARPLPGTEGAVAPFWSPDSRSLGFSAQGKVKKIDIAGGPAQALAEASSTGGNSGTGAWSPQGKILFSISAFSNLFLVSAAGGNRTEATKLDSKLGEGSHLHPEFLPDGEHYLYHVRAADATEFEIYVGRLGSSERTLLLRGVTDARYAPPRAGRPGYLLYVRDGTLMAQPFDSGKRALAGDAVAIAEQVATSNNATLADFSVSTNGVLAYRQTSSSSREQELAWYDRSGNQVSSVLKRSDAITAQRLSPDGKMAVFQLGRQGTGASQETWLADLERGVTSRFTFNGGVGPLWSADGSQIAFRRRGDGIYSRASNGAGPEKALWKDQAQLSPEDWSSDGRLLLITRRDATTGTDLWLLPIVGGADRDTKPIPLLRTKADEGSARFLPSSGAPKWFAYQSNESGINEIYVMALPSQPQGKWQVSNGGGTNPRWRGDARELFYLATDNRTIMAVDIDSGQSFRAGTPHVLFRVDRLANFNSWDASRDGKRFLLTVRDRQTSAPSINVILNWQAGLKK